MSRRFILWDLIASEVQLDRVKPDAASAVPEILAAISPQDRDEALRQALLPLTRIVDNQIAHNNFPEFFGPLPLEIDWREAQ